MDLDIGLKKLDLLLFGKNRVIYDIARSLKGNRIEKSPGQRKRFPCLHMLPAAQTRNKGDITPEQVKDICEQLKPDYDFIFIDCPAGIEQGFQNAIYAANQAIVVTNPEISAVRDADRIIGMLLSAKFEDEDIGLVVNRLRPEMVREGNMLSIEDLVEHLSIDLLGVIPEDKNVVISTNKGEPIILNEKSAAAAALNNIALRLSGEEVVIPTFQENLCCKS